MSMTAPPSPALSEASIHFCHSDSLKGSNVNSEDSDYCSPEIKRTKRFLSAQVGTRNGGTSKKPIFRNLIDVRRSGSHSSLKSVRNHKSCCAMQRDSSHSLPTLEVKGLSRSDFGRRSSLDENVLTDAVDAVGGGKGLKNDKRTLVLSSYCSHHKENEQFVVCKTDPSQAEISDPANETSSAFAQTVVETKMADLSETFESGEEQLCNMLMVQAPLKTLVCSRENYETWSTSNIPEDDGSVSLPKSSEVGETTETAQRAETPVGDTGDTETWSSHIEKKFKTELEFSTLLTLAYVRVRDLTKSIDQASQYLSTIDDKEEEEEASELLSEIESMFKARSELRYKHHKWCSNFSLHYEQRKKALSTLKSQAASAERTYFNLRKQLEDLQNEPVIRKHKRSWFSKLCGFVK